VICLFKKKAPFGAVVLNSRKINFVLQQVFASHKYDMDFAVIPAKEFADVYDEFGEAANHGLILLRKFFSLYEVFAIVVVSLALLR